MERKIDVGGHDEGNYFLESSLRAHFMPATGLEKLAGALAVLFSAFVWNMLSKDGSLSSLCFTTRFGGVGGIAVFAAAPGRKFELQRPRIIL